VPSPNVAVKIAMTIANKMEKMMTAGMDAMAASTMVAAMDREGIEIPTTVTRLP
jgi:hypothetical protein